MSIRPRPARASRFGFTMIELMVVVAIAAIVLALAAPALRQMTLNSRVGSEAGRWAASVRLARSEAVKRNTSVRMCISINQTSCAASGGWQQGWIVLVGTTVIQAEPGSGLGLRISEVASKTALDFDATGAGSTAASVTVCSDDGAREKVVSVGATGRVSLRNTNTGTCP
ncbi:MAG TPA: GspH/FimT family protein [Burkholderiaceae bacterium]|nr:GspH/FimT family protein [Burkholderiaceae bacterium]